MTTRDPNLCLSCKWLRTSDRDGYAVKYTCSAYPERIPVEISHGGADHREPRGDEINGIVFEMANTPQAQANFELWERVTRIGTV